MRGLILGTSIFLSILAMFAGIRLIDDVDASLRNLGGLYLIFLSGWIGSLSLDIALDRTGGRT